MKFLSKLLSAVSFIMLIFVILLMLAIYVPRLIGYDVYHIVSGSMEPTVPVNSLVLVKRLTTNSGSSIAVKEGDIIAFDSNGSVITHRVTEIIQEEQTFQTKGDANNQEDLQRVPYSNVKGVVVMTIPKAGAFFATISSTNGKIVLVAIIVLGVVLNALSGRLKPQETEAKKAGKKEASKKSSSEKGTPKEKSFKEEKPKEETAQEEASEKETSEK